MLAFIEHNFAVQPLQQADASAYAYADSFDYNQQPLPPVSLKISQIPQWEQRWLDQVAFDPEDDDNLT
jgi:hypothetical protein